MYGRDETRKQLLQTDQRQTTEEEQGEKLPCVASNGYCLVQLFWT